MGQGQLLIGLISIIIMMIPIGGLLWKLSKVVFQVELNKKDITDLASKLNLRIDKIEEHNRNIETSIVKLEVQMNNIESKINELTLDIKTILNSLIDKKE